MSFAVRYPNGREVDVPSRGSAVAYAKSASEKTPGKFEVIEVRIVATAEGGKSSGVFV